MVERWFKPKVHTGWEKDETPAYRRREVLKAHKGNVLASARAMQSLSNATKDKTTKRLSGQDARYFFKRYKRSK